MLHAQLSMLLNLNFVFKGFKQQYVEATIIKNVSMA